ncbi:unnamed protein product [Rhizophagus irregularis]|nr:unnamed protein product [Rhizophagus irregularis]
MMLYNQFNEIKETGTNGLITVYSEIWKTKNSDKEVALKWLHKPQESINFLINEAEKYLIKQEFQFQVLYGISQNLATGDYIFVQNNSINLSNWISGNGKIDDFIQKEHLKINGSYYDDSIEDFVFEWIPYNQFNEIKEIGTNGLITVYSAIWKDGPLHYNYDYDNDNDDNNYDYNNDNDDNNYDYNNDNDDNNYDYNNDYIRDSDKEVILKCLRNSQESIDSLINEAKKYSTKHKALQVLYGISQNPNTGDYILVQMNYTWDSGNEKIDDFIQERQLNINPYINVIFEWIPYNQFNEIKEIGKNCSITVYSAIWRDGPLRYNYNGYIRDSDEEVALKCLHNSQESIDSLINEAKKYSIKHKAFQILYGISQNPDTGDYILVQMNYTWDSGNKKIDDLIQESQLKINNNSDIVLEWIPYNQFNGIKETGTNGLITLYSAIWKDGPLYEKIDMRKKNYARDSDKKVALKCLYNSQQSIDSLINEVKKYPTNREALLVLYGISQNPNTGDYTLVQRNCVWDSGNEKIDNFIQESRLKINNNSDIVLEWIPYNQFNEIEESDTNSLITVYSAIWRDGPLHKNDNWGDYIRDSNKKVALKYLHNSQNSVDILINKAVEYLTKLFDISIRNIYGISQDPKTNNYILVLAWVSGNEKIDDFIWEMQSEIINNGNENDLVLEWIPYNQFNKIEESDTNGPITVYSAIWRDGPLHKKDNWSNYTRDSNKKVALKYLHNSQNSVDILINKVRKYLTNMFDRENCGIYGISQDSNTNDYILVLKWVSGNEKIYGFIMEMQLNSKNNLLFKWIPYSQFNKIKEISKSNSITIYSAVWKDVIRLKFSNYYSEEEKNKKIVLKLFHNSQDHINSLINEVKKYSASKFGEEFFEILYGISRNSDTNDYILVQKNFTWISGNKEIDDFIQKMQLKINNCEDAIFEWIPYYQFDHIKETSKNSLVPIHSAVWSDGPLHYHHGGYTRDSNKEVALKYLHNSENSIDFLINKAKKYSTKYGVSLVLYGISQNPNTNDYILVQNNFINLVNCLSGNEIIDDFIQEMQFKINDHNDIVFEWIPYNQFNNIKEIGKGGFATVYSAKWKDGLLEYDENNKIYKRDTNKIIALKCLHNSQNINNKFLNEIENFPINKRSNNLSIYGISQNPNTKEYIIVFKYAKKGNFNNWINKNYECFNWYDKLSVLDNIICGLEEIHQKKYIHRDFHTGNILFLREKIYNFGNSISISDMGLFGEVGNEDETKIYGVMPYVAPEVLRGKIYTQAADIYSLGMIMYFVATGRQPFYDRTHDHLLALDICKGVRPEINEPEAPSCYISLMKKCWDSDPNNRPNIIEVDDLITSFYKSSGVDFFIVENKEIEVQFNEAEKYRKSNLSSIKNYQAATHPQAIYVSRLLNPFTKDLSKYNDNSECLDCKV